MSWRRLVQTEIKRVVDVQSASNEEMNNVFKGISWKVLPWLAVSDGKSYIGALTCLHNLNEPSSYTAWV